MEIRIDIQVIPNKRNFKYLELIVKENAEIDDNVTHYIGTKWMK